MAFDAAIGYVILFGGRNNSNFFADTWEYRATQWTNLNVAGPSARAYVSLVYDPKVSSLVLFGGQTPGGELNDTWEFNGTAWVNETTVQGTSPSARFASAAVYDPQSQVVLLFGGFSNSSGLLGDTWTFGDSGWAKLSLVLAPPPRSDAQIVYDPIGTEILLYGGTTNTPARWDDVWQFTTGGTWTQATGAEDPTLEGRSGAAFVALTGLLPPGSELLLFGGSVAPSVMSNETWVFGSSLPLGVTNVVASGKWYEVGIPISLSVHAVGGQPGYTYTWNGLPAGCSSLDIDTIPCTPGAENSSETYEVTATVLDAGGSSLRSAKTTLVVAIAPLVTSFTPAPASVSVGSSITFSVNWKGGAGWVSFAYAGLPPGCQSTNHSKLTCQPNTTGLYPIEVNVTDALGIQSSKFSLLTVTSAAGGAGISPWVWVALIGGVGAVGVGTFVFYRRRRSPGAPEVSSQAGTGPG